MHFCILETKGRALLKPCARAESRQGEKGRKKPGQAGLAAAWAGRGQGQVGGKNQGRPTALIAGAGPDVIFSTGPQNVGEKTAPLFILALAGHPFHRGYPRGLLFSRGGSFSEKRRPRWNRRLF